MMGVSAAPRPSCPQGHCRGRLSPWSALKTHRMNWWERLSPGHLRAKGKQCPWGHGAHYGVPGGAV